jgi:hypothetical protein
LEKQREELIMKEKELEKKKKQQNGEKSGRSR